MKIVINAGSSSLKVALYEKENCLGRVHYDLGAKKVHWTNGKKKLDWETECTDVKHALRECAEHIRENYDVKKITQILHRVVHGGEFFHNATKITPAVKEKIQALSILAPLHNPPALACIKKAEEYFPYATHYAIFDTAYHQTLPEHAYRYALPEECYTKLKIRKYGFHGTSHKYLAKEAQRLTRTKKIITCHLGNGSSICANLNGKSIETTMGFTPTEGLPMGTRSGHIGPHIPLYLLKFYKTPERVDTLLDKQSGLLAIGGSADVRELWKHTKSSNKKEKEQAKLALTMLSYHIQNIIAQYHTVLGGAQCIIFSGGIGEGAWYVRRDAIAGLAHLGIKLDAKKNRAAVNKDTPTMIHAQNSKIKILVIPANEELQMIREIKN